MAILHRATLVPTKAELVAAWLPRQDWFGAPVDAVEALGAYRFDDPAGEVGIESHVMAAGNRTVHVPLTYRGAPLDGAEEWLVGVTEHSVLGTRWVYDAVGDPVYRAELVRVIGDAGTQVEMFVETPEGPQRREPTMQVRGSGGDPGTSPEIVVVREPSEAVSADGTVGTLTGTWPGGPAEAVLAYLR